MSEEFELGRYEFFPYEFEREDETPEETWEKLKNLAEEFRKEEERNAGDSVKSKKRMVWESP